MSKSIIILHRTELTQNVNINLETSRRIIQLAVKDNFKTEKVLYLDKIRYVLKNGLNKCLKNLNISNVKEIILKLEIVVIKNQSLKIMESI